MPIQWGGFQITTPQQLAGVIQGEAATPAGQFGVASVMYNRLQSGQFGSSISQVVTPTQFNGFNPNPSANAQSLANDLFAGNPPSGGTTGNALFFANPSGSTASWATSGGLAAGGANVGGEGNLFSDRMGAPSANFVAPVYGGTGQQVSAIGDVTGFTSQSGQNPSFVSTGNFGATTDPNSDNFIEPGATSGTGGGITTSLQYDTPPGPDGIGQAGVNGTTFDTSGMVGGGTASGGIASGDVSGSTFDTSGMVGGTATGATGMSSGGAVTGTTFDTSGMIAGGSPSGAAQGGATGQSQGGALQQGLSFLSGGGLPVNITDISGAGSVAGQSVQQGLNTAAQAVTTSESNLAVTGTGWLQSIFSSGENFFQRAGIALFGLIFIGFGLLWLTKDQVRKVV